MVCITYTEVLKMNPEIFIVLCPRVVTVKENTLSFFQEGRIFLVFLYATVNIYCLPLSPPFPPWLGEKKSLSQVICDLLPCSVNQLKIHSLQPFTQSGPIVQEDAASR